MSNRQAVGCLAAVLVVVVGIGAGAWVWYRGTPLGRRDGPPWEDLADEPIMEMEIEGAELEDLDGDTGVGPQARMGRSESWATRRWKPATDDWEAVFLDAVNGVVRHGADMSFVRCSSDGKVRAIGYVDVEIDGDVEGSRLMVIYVANPRGTGWLQVSLSTPGELPPLSEKDRGAFESDGCPNAFVRELKRVDAGRSPTTAGR